MIYWYLNIGLDTLYPRRHVDRHLYCIINANHNNNCILTREILHNSICILILCN